MKLADALDTVRRVAAVRATDVQTLPLARGHGRVLAEPLCTPEGRSIDAVVPGHVLTPMRIAHAAAAGVEVARVRRRPTVAVFVIESADRAATGAAQALLVGLLRGDGLEPTAWPALPADARSVEVAIRDAGCAFDAVVVCGDAPGRALADSVLGVFGDVRVDGLDVEGEVRVARFATLDAACVFALPLDPLAITGVHLTLGRALIDTLEARVESRRQLRGRLKGVRVCSGSFEWAHADVASDGASTLAPLGSGAQLEANAVLPPLSSTPRGDGPSVEALPFASA